MFLPYYSVICEQTKQINQFLFVEFNFKMCESVSEDSNSRVDEQVEKTILFEIRSTSLTAKKNILHTILSQNDSQDAEESKSDRNMSSKEPSFHGSDEELDLETEEEFCDPAALCEVLQEEKCAKRQKESPVERNIHSANSSYDSKLKYICELCNEQFSAKKQLARHKITHTAEKLYECERCKKLFKDKRYLVQHQKIHTDQLFICQYCGKSFMKKQNFTTHMHYHTSEKRYGCNFCDKTFFRKQNLKLHLLTHSGEKRFTCTHCSKVFSRKQNLDLHMIGHTGIKQYMCEHCSKRFTKKQNLKRHLLLHSGENPYVCTICNKGYNRREHLKAHILTHEGQKTDNITSISSEIDNTSIR